MQTFILADHGIIFNLPSSHPAQNEFALISISPMHSMHCIPNPEKSMKLSLGQASKKPKTYIWAFGLPPPDFGPP